MIQERRDEWNDWPKQSKVGRRGSNCGLSLKEMGGRNIARRVRVELPEMGKTFGKAEGEKANKRELMS